MTTSETIAIAAAAVRLYVESHPRPIQVTKTDAAKMPGISRPTVDSLIRAGTLSLNRLGKIPISQIDAGFGGSWGIFGEWGVTPRQIPMLTQRLGFQRFAAPTPCRRFPMWAMMP